MRIQFRNIGQAEFTLKTCLRVLKEETDVLPDEHLPSQRLRNAFCVGLGYSSYPELKKLMHPPLGDAWEEPEKEDFDEAICNGFEKAMELLLTENYIEAYHEDVPVMIGCDAAKELKEVMLPTATAAEFEMNGLLLLGVYESQSTDTAAHEDSPQILEGAESELRTAIAMEPRLIQAHRGLAEIEFARNNFEESRRLTEIALRLTIGSLETDAPDAFDWGSDGETLPYLEIRHALGLSLLKLGKHDDARREFDEILKRDKADRLGVRAILKDMGAA
jgi:tetratricopeptide (TPR) repeat protein